MKYLTRAKWGGGSLLKIPFFKGQKMHKPITLTLFVPKRDKVTKRSKLPSSMPPDFCAQMHTHRIHPPNAQLCVSVRDTYVRDASLTALVRISLDCTHPIKGGAASWTARRPYHHPAQPVCASLLPARSCNSSLSFPDCQKDGSLHQFSMCCFTWLCPRIVPVSVGNNLPASPFSSTETQQLPPMVSIFGTIRLLQGISPVVPARTLLETQGHARHLFRAHLPFQAVSISRAGTSVCIASWPLPNVVPPASDHSVYFQGQLNSWRSEWALSPLQHLLYYWCEH